MTTQYDTCPHCDISKSGEHHVYCPAHKQAAEISGLREILDPVIMDVIEEFPSLPKEVLVSAISKELKAIAEENQHYTSQELYERIIRRLGSN